MEIDEFNAVRRSMLLQGTAFVGGTAVLLSGCGGGGGGAVSNSATSNPPVLAIKTNPALALGGMVMDTYIRRRWTNPASSPWNVLPALAQNGYEWLRVGVTTQSFTELRSTANWYALPFKNEYWSCLEVSGALLREGAELGMRLQAMLFLSHLAAHAGTQARPPQWAGLSESDVASRVEEHARNVAEHYKSLSLSIEVFEIGNEIDFGVCGIQLGTTVSVPVGIDPVNTPVWMRDNLWKLGAPILKAAISGIRSVYPTAKFLLHVAGFGYSKDNVAASGFFQSMLDLNVPFDVAGLSFPYQFGSPTLPQPYFKDTAFLSTLEQIAKLGRPLQIVEFAYPADPAGATAIPSTAYPFNPMGQADFVRDLALAVRGKVQAIHYFYPDWYKGFDPGNTPLEGGGMFSAAGVPRPSLDIFKAIAERRLLT